MLGCCTIAEVQQNTENTSHVETEKIYSFKERIEVILNLMAIGKKNVGQGKGYHCLQAHSTSVCKLRRPVIGFLYLVPLTFPAYCSSKWPYLFLNML